MTVIFTRAETRVPAQDLDRARAWYADKLGIEPTEERPGGLHYATESGGFCVFASAGRSDGSYTQLALTVTDLAATMAELRDRGLEFLHFEGLTDGDGIAHVDGNYPSRGSGELGAWFHDSEGNLIGIGQSLA